MNTTSRDFKPARRENNFDRGDGNEAEGSSTSSSPQNSANSSPLPIRIVLADSEAIFRVGMSKILAAENDLEVVAQTETLPQTLNVVATVAAEVVLFEEGLSPNPADAVTEVARRAPPEVKVILVTPHAGQRETVDYLRRGVRGILSRGVSPDLLVRCVRKVAAGETWLDKQGVNWVIEAYRSQALQGTAPQDQLRLSGKEMLVISGVTQGMKNKEIAREVGTSEQVVKNYLRKIYDKLNVTDRLELALYSMHHRLLEGYSFPPTPGSGVAAAAAQAGEAHPASAAATAEQGSVQSPGPQPRLLGK